MKGRGEMKGKGEGSRDLTAALKRRGRSLSSAGRTLAPAWACSVMAYQRSPFGQARKEGKPEEGRKRKGKHAVMSDIKYGHCPPI